MMWKDLPTPCYVVDEGKIRKNLEILADLEQECGCHILLAQKAFSYVQPLSDDRAVHQRNNSERTV